MVVIGFAFIAQLTAGPDQPIATNIQLAAAGALSGIAVKWAKITNFVASDDSVAADGCARVTAVCRAVW